MEQGVSTDEEVGDDAVATLMGAAVGAPERAGAGGGRGRGRLEQHALVGEEAGVLRVVGKEGAGLGPDDVADDELTQALGLAQGLLRGWAMHGIVGGQVEQHRRVHSQLHRAAA